MRMSLPSIPWAHSTTGLGSVWQWTTPHFKATVNGDTRSCYWNIADLAEGRERIFADGRTATFEQAERQVRETIGKAYDPRLGYQVFAGSLATTFTISSGEQVDLGPYNGQPTEVIAVTSDGGTSRFTGIGQVRNYDFIIISDGHAVHISPTYIVEVGREGRLGERSHNATQGRTIDGAVVPGCTGRPGFLPGTVDHTDLPCPVHEEP